jgi:hypothetical protein
MTDTAANNWMDIKCDSLDPEIVHENWPELKPSAFSGYWYAKIIINHIKEPENVYWHWGVWFLISRKTLKPLTNSFRCIGSG